MPDCHLYGYGQVVHLYAHGFLMVSLPGQSHLFSADLLLLYEVVKQMPYVSGIADSKQTNVDCEACSVLNSHDMFK